MQRPFTNTDYHILQISPEIFRILTYLSFVLIIAVGWYLTTFYSKIHYHHNPMIEAFGYNNVCVLFDFPPSTYVLPMLYPIALIFWFLYLLTHWLRARFLIPSKIQFTFFTLIIGMEMMAAIIFSVIFAVHPNENLKLHYAGFAVFIFALVILALNNFIFFRKQMLLNASSTMKVLGVSYLVLALIVGILKLFLAFNFLILGNPWLQPFGYSLLTRDQMITIYLIIDRAWICLFLIIPLFFSFYLYKKLPNLTFKIMTKLNP